MKWRYVGLVLLGTLSSGLLSCAWVAGLQSYAANGDVGEGGGDVGSPNPPGTPGHFTLVNFVLAPDVMTATATATAPAVVAGDLLVAATFWDRSVATIASVTDTAGNKWLPVPQASHEKSPCASSSMVQIWYAENVVGGSDTVNVTITEDGEDLDFILLEYGGVATSNALDSHAGQIGTTASSAMSVMLTTTEQDLIVALFADTNGDTITAGAGYEVLSQSTYFSALAEDNLTGAGGGAAPGVQLPTAGLGASDACWAGSAVAFRAR